ncbi:hypothetical protein [Actinacidiphila sp. bgisy145]|uniref:hypothetical protein n=1 Tax=Actinacidiphila sp. bgisy145 TaxID=3413792 RepID=UPI003EBB1CC8
MNQPHQPDTELHALAAEFDAALRSLSTPGPAPQHLSEALTTVVGLTARLGPEIHDAHAALTTCAPADRSFHAATADQLCHAVAAAGRAVNELVKAQSAHLFIDHFPDLYGNADVNIAFARTRIATALTTARDNLSEAHSYLRDLTATNPASPLLHAARARSPRATTGASLSATSAASSSTHVPPNPSRRR